MMFSMLRNIPSCHYNPKIVFHQNKASPRPRKKFEVPKKRNNPLSAITMEPLKFAVRCLLLGRSGIPCMYERLRKVVTVAE